MKRRKKQLKAYSSSEKHPVAYLSMEIALENRIKTYAGGLGILAGDILRASARRKFPMVGLTLLSKEGYFKQKISVAGKQSEAIDKNYDLSLLEKLSTEIILPIGSEAIKVGVWRYFISGPDGFRNTVYLLDTDIAGNKSEYRRLTAKLYGGDLEYRLRQEIVLGRGGVKMLAALGYDIKKYHLNEGHGVLAAVELFLNSVSGGMDRKIEAVRKLCAFTAHTPVKTIYDEFPLPLLLKNQPDFPRGLPGIIKDKKFNTLAAGIFFCGYKNGVSIKHSKLLKEIFPDYHIDTITNGADSEYWTAPEFKKLYDGYLPGWRNDGRILKRAYKINIDDIWLAHQKAKRRLLRYLRLSCGVNWHGKVLTVCFARRFTEYKQPLLLFSDIERLLEILEAGGGAQIIMAGKAHPLDYSGKEAIKEIFRLQKRYPALRLVFLENYDIELARLLVAGADLWLNTPRPPFEACGTSGMKAAHNGVLQISTLDGWWPEGYVKGKTGWALDNADDLYATLEKEILPVYYRSPKKWKSMMRSSISLNASRFNTDRTIDEYIKRAYG